MSYETTEKSVQGGRPRELYTFELWGGTWRLTTSLENETLGGILYTATAGLSRSNVTEQPLGDNRDLVVTLPSTHAIASELLGNGIPPRRALVTIERFHDPTDTAYQIWRGGLAEIETDEQYARLRVVRQLDLAFDIRLPILKADRLCRHSLYGPGCKALRQNGVTQVTAVNGDQVTIDIALPDHTLDGGEIIRLVDNEPRTIVEQIGDVVRVDVPFRTLVAGVDDVIYARGCDGQITTCRDVFANVPNFGGHPQLPEVNPTTSQPPKGRTIWDQLG